MNILLIFSCFIIVFVIVLYYKRKLRNLSAKTKNNVHFYVARDENKTLWLCLGKPIRDYNCYITEICGSVISNSCNFKHFGLNTDDYKDLKWEDEPVEVFLNLED